MQPARLFCIVVSAVLLAYGAIGFYALPAATFQGNLSRMAPLPETLFGWRRPQPAVEPQLLRQTTLPEADVLVIGDSFSDGRIWQSVLARYGWKVRTESWHNMRGVCSDIEPWLRARGFKGRFVILEIVELNVAHDVSRFVPCEHMDYRLRADVDAPRLPPPVSFDPNHGDYQSKLSVGIRTLFNARLYGWLGASEDFGSWALNRDVVVVRQEHGCELFSHSRCADVLFLAEDAPGDVDPGALDDIEKLNAHFKDIIPIWAIVPNKSTAYRYPNKRFWKEARRRFQAPDLLEMTQAAIERRAVDLYFGNETHFSTTGYLLMGEEILRAMQGSRTADVAASKDSQRAR